MEKHEPSAWTGWSLPSSAFKIQQQFVLSQGGGGGSIKGNNNVGRKQLESTPPPIYFLQIDLASHLPQSLVFGRFAYLFCLHLHFFIIHIHK